MPFKARRSRGKRLIHRAELWREHARSRLAGYMVHLLDRQPARFCPRLRCSQTETALELMQHRLRAVRGQSILVCRELDEARAMSSLLPQTVEGLVDRPSVVNYASPDELVRPVPFHGLNPPDLQRFRCVWRHLSVTLAHNTVLMCLTWAPENVARRRDLGQKALSAIQRELLNLRLAVCSIVTSSGQGFDDRSAIRRNRGSPDVAPATN
jgi:hypothetical protein